VDLGSKVMECVLTWLDASRSHSCAAGSLKLPSGSILSSRDLRGSRFRFLHVRSTD
jgi:hypothetical protein